jgi:hypothetical protein
MIYLLEYDGVYCERCGSGLNPEILAIIIYIYIYTHTHTYIIYMKCLFSDRTNLDESLHSAAALNRMQACHYCSISL